MVPDGWIITTIGHCLLDATTRNFDNRLTHDDLRSVNKTLGMIPMKDRVKGKSVERAKVVKKGWFAYNPMRINVGSICRWENTEECIVSPDYVVFSCDERKIIGDYFDQFRQSHRWEKFMEDAGRGSVRIRIYLDDLKQLKCMLPPIHQQRRIAQILDTWDKAIEKTEKLIANGEAQKIALVQKLFGRLNSPLKSIGELADVFAGGTPSTKKEEFWGGEIPWMSSGEINLGIVKDVGGRITDLGLKNSSTKYVPENSVLIALAGQGKTRGKVAINRIKLCTNQSLAAIVPNEGLNAHFLFQNLNSRYQEIRSMSLGDGGRGGLNLSIIKHIKIPFPSSEEQMHIAKVLSNADAEIETMEQNRALLVTEKSALMQQLFTGKRRVKVEEITA